MEQHLIAEAEEMESCAFTWDQLYDLLSETLERFQRYLEQYDYDEEQAKQRVVLATLEGLGLDCPLRGFVLD